MPDVIALQGRRRPNRPAEPRGGSVITATPPKTRHIIRAQEEISAKRGNRIAIRHPLGRVVCMIEIVSPGNKGSRSALRSFVEKTLDFLRQGVHLDTDSYVPVPLEATYQATWTSCPEDMREAVERGEPLPDEAAE